MASNFGIKNNQTGKKVTPYYNPAKHPGAVVPGTIAPATVTPDFRDAIYNDVINAGQRNVANTQAQIAGQIGLLRNRYGYLDDSFNVDPNNPYGQAQLLKRSYDNSRQGTENSYASRGQMTSGAYGRMQASNLFDYGQRNNALQNSYLSENAQLQNQLQQARDNYAMNVVPQAAGDALSRAIQSGAGAVSSGGSTSSNEAKHGPIVRSYFDANGNKVNVHQDGTPFTVKRK
jgi:hypothetical protein